MSEEEKKALAYFDKLESWELKAYQGGYGDNWIVAVGEGVRLYCYQCWKDKQEPTFAGLIAYLEKKADCRKAVFPG